MDRLINLELIGIGQVDFIVIAATTVFNK